MAAESFPKLLLLIAVFIGSIALQSSILIQSAASSPAQFQGSKFSTSSSISMYKRARAIVPRLERTKHKGQAGRVGVVGGSVEYTGAPFYAAIGALRCGADLAFVFCGDPDAAMPIKTYSPELIVYPRMSALNSTLSRLSALIIGPGLGRDSEVLKQASSAIEAARAGNVPIVLDGDALWLIKDRPELIRGYARAILTPNAMEFDRLHRVAFSDEPAPKLEPLGESTPAGIHLDIAKEPARSVARLAEWLGGVTVLRKGPVDVISNGASAVGCVAFGSSRRCGGQGDVLAGTTGVFLGWADSASAEAPVDTLGAAYGAALLTRRANSLAFEQHGRSTTTPDLISSLGTAFKDLYDDETSPFCAL